MKRKIYNRFVVRIIRTLRDSLTLLTGVRVCCGHLHVICWKETSDPIELSFPPIGIVLVQNADGLTFVEAHLVTVGSCVVIQGYHLTD